MDTRVATLYSFLRLSALRCYHRCFSRWDTQYLFQPLKFINGSNMAYMHVIFVVKNKAVKTVHFSNANFWIRVYSLKCWENNTSKMTRSGCCWSLQADFHIKTVSLLIPFLCWFVMISPAILFLFFTFYVSWDSVLQDFETCLSLSVPICTFQLCEC
jgi:hypothetical protein